MDLNNAFAGLEINVRTCWIKFKKKKNEFQ